MEEPKFELRAQDKFAPKILEIWACEVDRAALKLPNGVHAGQCKAKASEARARAHEMRAWQERNGSKIPD